MRFGRGDGVLVAGVGVAHDAGRRVVPQHARDPSRRFRRAVATTTMPACCEKPMPTPPPWWNDTQVAPEAQLSSALSSGQSDTASEPSFIASVSRLGLATEPESRWSRPITIGAFSSPSPPSR